MGILPGAMTIDLHDLDIMPCQNSANADPDNSDTANLDTASSDTESSDSTRPDFRNVFNKFTTLIRNSQISRSRPVVVDDMSGGVWTAPLVATMMMNAGHPDVFILDGGLPRWKKEYGLSDVAGSNARKLVFPPCVEALSSHHYGPDGFNQQSGDIFVDYEDVLKRDSTAQLVSLRHSWEFSQTGGDLPGSHNLPYSDLVSDDTLISEVLRPDYELRQAFDKAGIDPDKPIIAYCTMGIVTPVMKLALEEIDSPAINSLKLFQGGWQEYAAKLT